MHFRLIPRSTNLGNPLIILNPSFFSSLELHLPRIPQWLLLMLSQLESGLSSLTRVRRPSSFFYAYWRIRLVTMKLGGLLSYTKWCPDEWSRHTLPKLKSSKNSSICFVGENEHMYAPAPRLCFWRIYIGMMRLSL